MSKRTLDSFFTPTPKKPKHEIEGDEEAEYSHHTNYVFPIPHLPSSIGSDIDSLPATVGKEMNNQPDLDLFYFEPYIPSCMAKELFLFLRSQLPFYRVEYKIKRGGIETQVRTPRYTTVFGIDETSRFDDDGSIVDARTCAPVIADRRYDRIPPRPIPHCLDVLRASAERATGCRFNFCLVNYYASGADSISPHSDDERFLGPEPAIASFSLGARRDFVMRHKDASKETKKLMLPLASGDMVLMRGPTQASWLHSIPKRGGKKGVEDGGRINITFRRAMVRGGTENYYNYNVGAGRVYRWNKTSGEMQAI